MQDTAYDQESERLAKTKEEGGSCEGEETDEEREAARGGVVSEVAAYRCGGGLGKISRANKVVVATYVRKRREQHHRRLGGQRSSAALFM